MAALSEHRKESENDEFDTIVDPETNKPVPVNSDVGTQIIKNYIECIKNGPDSPNIISTRNFYNKKEKEKYADLEPTEFAKKLRHNQVRLEAIQKGNYIDNDASPKINKCVWVKRSSGKYQLGNIGNIMNDKVDVYFNNDGKVAVKSGMDVESLLYVSSSFKDKFTED